MLMTADQPDPPSFLPGKQVGRTGQGAQGEGCRTHLASGPHPPRLQDPGQVRSLTPTGAGYVERSPRKSGRRPSASSQRWQSWWSRTISPWQGCSRFRFFLMYVVQTYPWINLHLTIDSWRPFRGADGFKLRGKELENVLAWGLNDNLPCRRGDDEPEDHMEGGPSMTNTSLQGGEPRVDVRPAPRFLQDLDYLWRLTEPKAPPRQLYQAKHSLALFVIGDASGKAKEAVVVSQYGLDYESGVWSQLWRRRSSNVREAENLTDRLERLAGNIGRNVAERVEELNATGALADHEVFVLS
jgi:hypothetical protein